MNKAVTILADFLAVILWVVAGATALTYWMLSPVPADRLHDTLGHVAVLELVAGFFFWLTARGFMKRWRDFRAEEDTGLTVEGEDDDV